MIIQKPIEDNSIVTLRLVTGETIIGRLKTRNDKHIVMNKPLMIHARLENNQVGLEFHPFILTSEDENFTLPLTGILVEPSRPSKDLLENYQKITSSIIT